MAGGDKMRSPTWILITVFLSATLLFADASGRWAGAIVDDRGSSPALLILQQDGTKLTGTAGSDDNDRHAIQNATIEGDTLRFEVPRGDAVMTLVLKINGDEMTGTIELKRNNETVRTGRLSFKRQ